MSEQLFRAARRVVEKLPAGLDRSWQGVGMFALPIDCLIDLQEAVNAPDSARAHCLGCGTAQGLGQPVRSWCDRDGCRERYERSIRRDGMAYP